MPIILELTSDDEEIVRKAASLRGEDVNRYAVDALVQAARQDTAMRRSKPLAQFVAEQRSKHGFPSDWGTGKAELSEADWGTVAAAFGDATTAEQ